MERKLTSVDKLYKLRQLFPETLEHRRGKAQRKNRQKKWLNQEQKKAA